MEAVEVIIQNKIVQNDETPVPQFIVTKADFIAVVNTGALIHSIIFAFLVLFCT